MEGWGTGYSHMCMAWHGTFAIWLRRAHSKAASAHLAGVLLAAHRTTHQPPTYWLQRAAWQSDSAVKTAHAMLQRVWTRANAVRAAQKLPPRQAELGKAPAYQIVWRR